MFPNEDNYIIYLKAKIGLTLRTPFGISGSFHWTSTVLELSGLARTFCGGLPGAEKLSKYS
jgi:hypothetical protein